MHCEQSTVFVYLYNNADLRRPKMDRLGIGAKEKLSSQVNGGSLRQSHKEPVTSCSSLPAEKRGSSSRKAIVRVQVEVASIEQ